MKQLIIFIFLFFVLGTVVSAETPVSKTQELLDRVATKVATLALKLRRAYVGQIKSVGTSSFIISTLEGNRTVFINDATTFFRIRAGTRTEINFDKFKVGDDVIALGTIDPDTLDLTARQVISKVKRFNIPGIVTAISESIITVSEFNGPTEKIDLSDVVKITKASASGEIVAGKFKDVVVGSKIFVMAYVDKSQGEILSGLRALLLLK